MRGGIAHYIALLYRKLEERGHGVRVLSFYRQYPSFLFPGSTQKDEGTELIPVHAHPLLDSINPLSWIRAYFWLKKGKPDLILFKYWMPFFAPCYATLAFLSKFLLHVKIVYLCDNIIPHEKKPGDILLTRLGLRFVDFFIVQSRSVLNDLLRFRPEAQYSEVSHPVYEIFPAPVSKTEARKRLGIPDVKTILYFGYIRHYKGLPFLIEAMSVAGLKSIRLLVCGEFYEGREEVLEQIGHLGLRDSITLVDRFIPNEDVPLYFCASDLVVLPYVSATQSGIVQVAYHYNKPVIITRVGGLPEVVLDGRTGYVVPPRDAEALATAILKFYREDKEAVFVEAVKEVKKRYSWDRMVEAVETAMHEGTKTLG